MKIRLNFLSFCLTAILAMMAFNSCQKENGGEYKNLLTINGENVPFESVAVDFDEENDGVTIVPRIPEDYPMGSLIIQFAGSLIGTRVDLSVLDKYAPVIATHYVHSVYFYKEE